MQSFSGRIRQELGHKTPILDSECSVSVSALVTLVELGDIKCFGNLNFPEISPFENRTISLLRGFRRPSGKNLGCTPTQVDIVTKFNSINTHMIHGTGTVY